MSVSKRVSPAKIVLGIIISQFAGAAGALFTFDSISTFYENLNKPSFAPPNWVFGPVWVTLYTLMGISLGVVWSRGLKEKAVRTGVAIFASQLALNFLWTLIFFGLRSILYGLVEIVVLWAVILLTIISFFRISRAAGLLLVPYLCWVSVATVLNYFIWVLN